MFGGKTFNNFQLHVSVNESKFILCSVGVFPIELKIFHVRALIMIRRRLKAHLGEQYI
jgi:hypothetical protein